MFCKAELSEERIIDVRSDRQLMDLVSSTPHLRAFAKSARWVKPEDANVPSKSVRYVYRSWKMIDWFSTKDCSENQAHAVPGRHPRSSNGGRSALY
jgi:hypothetical protein